MRVCMYDINICPHTYICTHTHTNTDIYTCVHIHAYIHTDKYIYIYTYIHTYIYAHRGRVPRTSNKLNSRRMIKMVDVRRKDSTVGMINMVDLNLMRKDGLTMKHLLVQYIKKCIHEYMEACMYIPMVGWSRANESK